MAYALPSCSPIEASIALITSTSSAYDDLAQTINGPLHVTLTTDNGTAPEVPGSARLKGTFCTINAPVRVSLRRTFAGTFDLRGFQFLPPSVRAQPCTNNGHTRRVQHTGSRHGRVTGTVVWDPAGLEVGREGSVSVQTTNGSLKLSL